MHVCTAHMYVFVCVSNVWGAERVYVQAWTYLWRRVNHWGKCTVHSSCNIYVTKSEWERLCTLWPNHWYRYESLGHVVVDAGVCVVCWCCMCVNACTLDPGHGQREWFMTPPFGRRPLRIARECNACVSGVCHNTFRIDYFIGLRLNGHKIDGSAWKWKDSE